MKKLFKKIKDGVLSFTGILARHPSLLILALSYSIAFANEALSRHSIWEALVFVFTRPFSFLCNMAIIAVCETLVLLSQKRKFWLWFVSLFWFAMGVTNFVVKFYRITPFNAMDVVLVKSIFPILPLYLGWFGLILCAALILTALIILGIVYFKIKKQKVNYKSSALRLLVVSVVTSLLISGGFLTGAIPQNFSSLPEGYDKHGFTLCLCITVFDRGIDKPDGYEENIDELVSDVVGTENGTVDMPQKTPNIIFVQLESFYDLASLEGFEFSEDPTPVFTELKNNCASGTLTVPSIGAGTANTEFEVLCGMSLKYFGAAEYPYETILQKSTNESICFVLDKYGYSSHAVHNYKANFYARKHVYSMLGFNTFVSSEYMNGLDYNQAGWARDEVLIDYVIGCLELTDGPDFVQCITVQAHGKYPTSAYEGENTDPIDLISLPDGANRHAYKYLANQLRGTDEFIGDLVTAVQERNEDTVIVFYSDHIPNIGIEDDWLDDGLTLYNTEYVIWRSDGVKTEDKSFASYQLYSEVFDLLGIEGGVMSKLHSMRGELDEAKYSYALHSLQYDILYGDCVAYGGKIPFEPTDIKLGLTDITITDVYHSNGEIYVKGVGFTESSKVFVNGHSEDTEFVDDTTLILSGVKLDSGDKIKIVQVSDLIFHISSSEVYIYTEE